MMRVFLIACGFSSAFGSIACDRPGERHEKISKLRTIGVTADPAVIAPVAAGIEAKVKLRGVLALASADETVSVETFADSSQLYSSSANGLAVDPNSITYTALGPLRLMNFEASFLYPETKLLTAKDATVARLRYGFLASSGDEEEKIVGDVLVIADGSPELQWINPVVKITAPETSEKIAAGSTYELVVELENPNDERLKIGWFVSSGEVKNRRAKRAEWSGFDSGEQTIIATVRGSKSRTFGYATVVVVVE